MFDVAERRNFLDLIRPPGGYRLEAAIGTTYSLDFVALTATLMALVDAEMAEEEGRSNPVEWLHAITRLADRVQLFVQRARIEGPRKVSRITLLYDRIVHEIQLPNGGSFHPKAWIAYYTPKQTRDMEGQPGIVRLVCASRNLTNSQCWEAFVAIEGTTGEARVNAPLNRDIESFLTSIAPPQARKVSAHRRLLAAIERTRFESVGPLRDSARLRWQTSGGAKLREHVPSSGRRALVVSPFLKASFLKPLLDGYGQVVVISTQKSLDDIADETILAKLMSGRNKAYVVQDSHGADPALDLHAKIYVFEGEKGRSVFIGSANGTPSGWHARNVEAAVQFAPGFSVDHFCDKFVFRERPAGSGKKRDLRGWITEYARQVRKEDEIDTADKLLDEIRSEIARLELRATYDTEAHTLRLNLVRDVDPSAEITRWVESCEVLIGPLAESDTKDSMQPLASLVGGDIVWAGVGVKDLTDFFVVRVSHRRLKVEQEFIVKAITSFDRDHRDAKLLEALLTREKLRAFLEAILFDASIRPTSAQALGTANGGGGGLARPLLSDVAIEDILRACTEDPSRIEEINRLIRAVGQTDLVDSEFRDFWCTFVAAHHEASRQDSHA